MNRGVVVSLIVAATSLGCMAKSQPPSSASLWDVYQSAFKNAKYIDLTHSITPSIPVWAGFGPATFGPTVDPKTRRPYTWAKDGFEATRYVLATDQLGTQLDPPAHWNPDYPAIDELPATFAVRPLVVINISDSTAKQPGYHLGMVDINAWEKAHGTVPEGSVVFIRSGWSKDWPNPELTTRRPIPGITLEAIQFLHLQRHILFHGHEALDADTTAKLDVEHWLLTSGYTQAEGVANLDQVPEYGCLVAMGYPKFQGGVGGYARFVAICPPDWPHGVTIHSATESPLPKQSKPLHWDAKQGMRVR
jgi:kynurenine formamidase